MKKNTGTHKFIFLCRLFCSIFVGIFFFFTGGLYPAMAAKRLFSDDDLVIVIDPGHGGENFGTTENGFTEKEMTLRVANVMAEELQKYDNVTVYLTRKDDRDISLKERAVFAENVDADFVFSIHFNASQDHQNFGSEVWIPAHSPYHAYAYQFAYTELTELKELGLFIRGIKTRVESDVEYYGIIRESLKLSIPALIIEHCHVDHETDSVFCDTDEKLVTLGKTDARAVAKFLGLKSKKLGVDYSDYEEFPEIRENELKKLTLNAMTPPEVCQIEATQIHEENGTVDLTVTASDQDSLILYYEYSLDDGKTWYPRKIWPDTDPLGGTSLETAELSIQIPPGLKAKIKFRVYNLFDMTTESNTIELSETFYYSSSPEENAPMETIVEDVNEPVIGGDYSDDKAVFSPMDTDEILQKLKKKMYPYLETVLVAALFLITVLLSVLLFNSRHRKKKRRRSHRNKR